MSDSAPIFILGLQRGGTNQLLNALRSHPDTIWPDGEMHEVLRPKPALRGATAKTLAGYLPTALRSGDIMNPRRAPGPLRPRDGRGSPASWPVPRNGTCPKCGASSARWRRRGLVRLSPRGAPAWC